MTVAVILAGLVPILWGSGACSEAMSRIATPMVGGMITAPLLSMFVMPVAYRLMHVRQGVTECVQDHLNLSTPYTYVHSKGGDFEMTTITESLGKTSMIAVCLFVVGCATEHQGLVHCTILQQAGHCVAVPVQDAEHEAQAKSLQRAESGASYIYVVRPYAQQRSEASDVFVDGKLEAKLGPMTFARLKVEAGSHSIRVVTAKVPDVTMDVIATDNVYVQYQLLELFATVTPKIEMMSTDGMKKLLRPLGLVVSSD
jgi:hypothetical protein